MIRRFVLRGDQMTAQIRASIVPIVKNRTSFALFEGTSKRTGHLKTLMA